MSLSSHWMNRSGLPRFPKLEQDMEADHVVVGGGITGITAAFLLKKAGQKVILLERDRCARADTGHTTAHLTYVTDTRLTRLVKTFGRDHAAAAWEAGEAAMAQIKSLVDEAAIECDYKTVPGFLHAPWGEMAKDDIQQLQDEAALAAELGFDAAYLDSVPFAKRPGIRFANQGMFHPLKYLGGLLASLSGDGSHVFEHSEVVEFEQDPPAVKVGKFSVRCKSVIIATHVPLQGNAGAIAAGLFQSKLMSYSSYAVGAKIAKKSALEALFWDTSDPYYYLRIDHRPKHAYAILGGEDHKTGQETNADERFARLEEKLVSILPDAEINSRWTGQVVETPDGLPYIGEIADRQFIATGFAGNGMTFGALAGMMASDAALGRSNPWRDLFDVNRKTLSATWDYLKENIDYPYYFLKDKLSAAEGTHLRDVQPGEGKILKIDRQRLAVYRSPSGEVTTRSPSCTHMGCDVHWNVADSTWDCPCHGSRFRSTGQVLAGPAESDLEKISLADHAK